MRLEFAKRHLSILAFPAVDVPSLTIVVGINGSGKTHLLQAIQNGSITNSIVQFIGPAANGGEGPIRLLSQSGHSISDAGPYSPHDGTQTPARMSRQSGKFVAARRAVLEPFSTRLEQITSGKISQNLQPTEDVWRLGADEAVRRSGDERFKTDVHSIFKQAAQELLVKRDALRTPPGLETIEIQILNSISTISQKLGISPLAVTEEQEQQYRPWIADLFQNSIPTVFGRYRDAMLRNNLQQLHDQKNGGNDALSDELFSERFGPPPWEQITETLHSFGLAYDASPPDLYAYTPVHFTLAKRPGGEPVSISNLSSGERILLQFALSSFNYDESLVNVNRPAVLLLDEMDAPLHPEMVHRWLSVISHELVDRQGMHCVVTTHSPTTVALAPESSLYEMKDGFSGLNKISKQDALNKLTFGVPTLSIDYSGRRQVFTESDTDAAIYERIYSLIKSGMRCERELNFLSTGMRDKDSVEFNSGCMIVKKIVENLYGAGNTAVYGIVDWDGVAVSNDRVKVIAEGLRDGIESVVLDPLLVCLLLMKIRRAPVGIEDIDRFAGADALQAVDLQRMVDAIQHPAFPMSKGDKVEVEYLGGAKVGVLRDYLTVNDHDLEAALSNAHPALRKWTNRRGDMVKAVVEEVLTEHRAFCPIELKVVFEAIANAAA